MNKALILEQLKRMWNTQVPFTGMLGLEIIRFDAVEAEIRFKWQDTLIGNPVQKILHGGVTATVLDMAGGVVVAASIVEHAKDISPQSLQEKLSKLGTIDLRTDYLRPGRGEEFITTAKIIRGGSKVAVTRMEMHNEKGEHIAFGTGTYLVG
jgi:uncharacterized protein (TIGR00369 family)